MNRSRKIFAAVGVAAVTLFATAGVALAGDYSGDNGGGGGDDNDHHHHKRHHHHHDGDDDNDNSSDSDNSD